MTYIDTYKCWMWAVARLLEPRRNGIRRGLAHAGVRATLAAARAAEQAEHAPRPQPRVQETGDRSRSLFPLPRASAARGFFWAGPGPAPFCGGW